VLVMVGVFVWCGVDVWVFCGDDGFDELIMMIIFLFWVVYDGEVIEYVVDFLVLGLCIGIVEEL